MGGKDTLPPQLPGIGSFRSKNARAGLHGCSSFLKECWRLGDSELLGVRI